MQAEPPRSLDPACSIELFAEHPDIVTPIGAAFDHHGRLLVIESHTHFPPEGYAGPKVDRIRVIEDTNNDGRADRFSTFWEGSHATMSLRRGPAPWVYVATRMHIFRIADRDSDGEAETLEELVHLRTPGNYPHNGLCGLAFDRHGNLVFGLGENLGEPYTLQARDGSKWQGGGEGGSIFRCTLEGCQLERIATGFWNPFGIHVDSYNRIWEVENDPDASPPCRLIHVLAGGDYGYQFRYGRTGRHPLQAWNGELPGTLPMAGATGEAPCTVLPWQGKLWVTSWGDHRIERFSLQPRGASFVATSETVIQGGDDFRPVDLALSPHGDLFVTDWVDKSYPVHGQGRIWRVRSTSPIDLHDDKMPAPTADERLAITLITSAGQPVAENGAPPQLDVERYLDHPDPYLRQAAVWAVIQRPTSGLPSWDRRLSKGMKLALLQRARWLTPHGTPLAPESVSLVEQALTDDDPDVRLYAVRMVADYRVQHVQAQLDEQLTDARMSPRLFQAILAAREWLDAGRVTLSREPSYDEYLLRVLRSSQPPPPLLAAALRLIDPNHSQLDVKRLEAWSVHDNAAVRREAVRCLALRGGQEVVPVLVRIARDERRAVAERADALAGLAGRADGHVGFLREFAHLPADNPLAHAAQLALQATVPSSADPAPPTDEQIEHLLAEERLSGDKDRGWRLFFSAHGPRCSSCHRWAGRGSSVGPDLTGIGRRVPRRRLLESIVDPSREIAPQYTPWLIELDDGRVFVALFVGSDALQHTEQFLLADGTVHIVASDRIVSRRATTGSLMPSGYYRLLTRQDLLDLLALLESE